jgi:DNA replication protein DnaD
MYNKNDLISGFCEGWKAGKGSNLRIEDNELINYTTVIAKRDLKNQTMYINKQHYSNTTTRNTNLVREYSEYMGLEIVEVEAEELN